MVCRPECFTDGRFWETAALNRGLLVRFDTDSDRAKSWLIAATDPQR